MSPFVELSPGDDLKFTTRHVFVLTAVSAVIVGGLIHVSNLSTVKGSVVDLSGNPVDGVAIQIGSSSSPIVTNLHGNFRFSDKKDVYYHPFIRVIDDDYILRGGARFWRPATKNVRDVKLVVEAAGSIAGQVVDSSGLPFAGLHVRGHAAETNRFVFACISDKEGRFSYGPILPGVYNLSPVCRSVSLGSVTIHAFSETEVELVFDG